MLGWVTLFSTSTWIPVAISTSYRSSRPDVFLRKGVLRICSKFTGEHPCRSVVSIKLLCKFIEITPRNGCSSVSISLPSGYTGLSSSKCEQVTKTACRIMIGYCCIKATLMATLNFTLLSQTPACMQKPSHNAQKMKFSIIFSVNVIKTTGNCRFGHIYSGNADWKTSFFVQ